MTTQQIRCVLVNALIEDGENTIEIPWQSEESEIAYWELMDPEPA